MKTFNIAVIKPENYAHADVFLELGELLFHAMKELGYETTIGFNNINDQTRNIIIGCHLLDVDCIDQIPKSSIILNTEQMHSDAHWNPAIFEWARNFEVWDYSPKNISKFAEMGVRGVKHLRIGFQKELNRIPKQPVKEFDVLFYGSMNERRHRIIQELISRGANVKTLFAVYGKERDEFIARSKVVLNHHFYESQIFEIVRVFYLLTNAIAVVGEVNDTTAIDDVYKGAISSAGYEGLVDKCLELIGNDALRERSGTRGFEVISKCPQSEYISRILS
jgi:hypothetical protein